MLIKRILLVSFLLAPVLASAQFTDGGTGLLSAPSAEMNKYGVFTITNNFLNEHYLPSNGWDYNTFEYGFGLTFWSRLEINYVCTLFWGDWSPHAQGPNGTYREKILKNQDRHFAAKLLALKEGELRNWTPSIAIGVSDPVTGAGGGQYIGSDVSSSNGYFNRLYVVATKHFNTPVGVLGSHLGYQYSKRVDWNRTGLIAAVDWEPVWIQNRWFSPKFILEYDANTVNFGFISSIWNERFEAMFELENFQWISFGLRYKLRIVGSE